MKEEMFKELLESVREAGAIMRGEREPSRAFVVEQSGQGAVADRCDPSGSGTGSRKRS